MIICDNARDPALHHTISNFSFLGYPKIKIERPFKIISDTSLALIEETVENSLFYRATWPGYVRDMK